MDRTFNKNEMKMLLSAFENFKEDEKKRQEKADAKQWSDIEVPLILRSGLSRLTKYELSEIAANLQIRGVSQFRKQELIEELARQIPASFINLLLYFDNSRFELVQNTALSHFSTFDFELINSRQIRYFLKRGFLFPGTVRGERALVMPQEIIQAVREISKTKVFPRLQKNTEWIQLTHGMLYYYGTLGMHELQDLLEKYTGEKMDYGLLYQVLYEAAAYYDEIRHDREGFSYYRVSDSNKVKAEHRSRRDLSYYPFTKEQLLKAGKLRFVDKNAAFRDFVKWIRKHYTISPDEAGGIVEECVYAVNLGEPLSNIMQFLQSRLEFDHLEIVQEISEQLAHFMNHTRQWDLKGHTSDELYVKKDSSLTPLPTGRKVVTQRPPVQKVGRNDPCPCGSGKKYKKCCGTT